MLPRAWPYLQQPVPWREQPAAGTDNEDDLVGCHGLWQHKSTTSDYTDRVALTRIAVIDPATHNEALCVLSAYFVEKLLGQKQYAHESALV